MESEVWKPVKDYEDIYEVSNLGRVRNVISNLIKKEQDSNTGSLYVKLSKNGTYKKFYIQRLVAEAFIDNQNHFDVVCHIDNDYKNNNVSNLKWTNRKEIHQKIHESNLKNHYKSICKEVIYNNELYESKKILCNKKNINYKSFSSRLDLGWTLEEAIKIPINAIRGNNKILYKYNGKKMKLTHIYKKNDHKTCINTFYYRVREGWSIDEALNIPVLQ